MSGTMVFLALAIVFGVLVLAAVLYLSRRLPRRLDQQYFSQQWSEILSRVKTPEGMILAVIDGDKLLDEALKRRGYKGKTMGGRMVAAQRLFSDNDSVWYAHKLRNRLVHEPKIKLGKRDAQKALAGFKKGLQDLGAL